MESNVQFYQSEIFVANRITDDLASVLGDGYTVISNCINPANRCISSHVVFGRYINKITYNFTESKWVTEINEFISTHRLCFDNFIEKYDKRSRRSFHDKKTAVSLCKIYHNYPKDKKNTIDGTIYRFHQENKCRIKYFAFQDIANYAYTRWPVVNISLRLDQVDCSKKISWVLRQDDGTESENIEQLNAAVSNQSQSEPWHNWLEYLFYGIDDFSPSNISEEARKTVYSDTFKLSIPFYDAHVNGQPCGSWKGQIVILSETFRTDQNVEDFYTTHCQVLSEYAAKLCDKLKESARGELSKLPIRYHDVLRDLLYKISLIQDWERVIAFTDNKLDRNYCFERKKSRSTDFPYQEIWHACKDDGSLEACDSCCKIDQNPLESLLRNEYQYYYPVTLGTRHFFCIRLKYLLDRNIIPSLSDQIYDAAGRHGNTLLCFEFPSSAIFPLKSDRDPEIEKLGLYYINQLLPVFDSLITARKVLYHGIKSATNAIISRNHSHHIGSHVTPRTSIEKIAARLLNVAGIIKKDQILAAIQPLKLRMDNYVQQKADFMAEIATTSLYTTVAKPFFSQVVSRFIHNTLLMDNIGANEGVNYQQFNGKWKNRLRIKLLHNGELVTVNYKKISSVDPGCFTNENILYVIPEKIVCSLSKNGSAFPDLNIAWPGPLGEFALYCFLENFIRNAVKHNTSILCSEANAEKKHLNIFINVEELEVNDPRHNELYQVEIYDDVTVPTDELLESLKKKVAPSYMIIENDGRLKKGGWGIAEMRIMSNLLGGSDDFTMMDKLSVDKIHKKDVDASQEHERLVYRFTCMKAKEILIIAAPNDGSGLPDLRNKGIYHYQDFTAFEKSRQSGAPISTFGIAVLDKNAALQIKGKELSLPFRVLAEESDDIGVVKVKKAFIQDVIQKDVMQIRNLVWAEWGKRFMPHDGWQNHSLFLFFNDDKGSGQTQKWSALCNDQQQPEFLPALLPLYKGKGVDSAKGKNNNICYDRHLEGCPKLLEKSKGICFIEPLEANSADFVPLMSTEPSFMLWSKLVESGCLKILVIDERLAEAAVTEMSVKQVKSSETNGNPYVYENTKRMEVARKANIFIATHLQLPDSEVKSVHHTVTNLADEEQLVVHFSKDGAGKWTLSVPELLHAPDVLIIHQGVADTLLEKVICGDRENFKQAFMGFLQDIQKQIPYILVDSGRGIPSDLPDNVKFMPFSLLESFVMQGSISKYSLSDVIMSITRDIAANERSQ